MMFAMATENQAGVDAKEHAQVSNPKLQVRPQTTQEQRSEVHRKLGRLLLRLQQYELLTKEILVSHNLSGTVSNWHERRQARIEEFSRKSLGQLMEVMTESYLTSQSEREESAYSKAPKDLTEIWFSFRGELQMDPQGYADTVAAMKELVALRNDIVHHFLERFDLWSLESCSAADAHLDQSYELVDHHMEQLLGWARQVNEAAQTTASFMATPEYHEFLVANASAPLPELSGQSSVAERLREAEASLASNGWTLLDEAIVFIARIDPQESPTRYRRKNWRQILNGCGTFEMQRIALPERSGLYTAYRSKSEA